MVIAPEHPKRPNRKPIVPARAKNYEGFTEDYHKTQGYLWTQDLDRGFPGFEVWRDKDDTMCIRQENGNNATGGSTVELVRLTDGQAYGLLKAISRCMEVC